jgi:hypothetical protein
LTWPFPVKFWVKVIKQFYDSQTDLPLWIIRNRIITFFDRKPKTKFPKPYSGWLWGQPVNNLIKYNSSNKVKLFKLLVFLRENVVLTLRGEVVIDKNSPLKWSFLEVYSCTIGLKFVNSFQLQIVRIYVKPSATSFWLTTAILSKNLNLVNHLTYFKSNPSLKGSEL